MDNDERLFARKVGDFLESLNMDMKYEEAYFYHFSNFEVIPSLKRFWEETENRNIAFEEFLKGVTNMPDRTGQKHIYCPCCGWNWYFLSATRCSCGETLWDSKERYERWAAS